MKNIEELDNSWASLGIWIIVRVGDKEVQAKIERTPSPQYILARSSVALTELSQDIKDPAFSREYQIGLLLPGNKEPTWFPADGSSLMSLTLFAKSVYESFHKWLLEQNPDNVIDLKNRTLN